MGIEPGRIEYVRRPTEPAAGVPVLDDSQRAVVDHGSGPLLVLAGPGTGKTTTLVETVVDRIEHRGLTPDQVLVLTFSRKAAEELRGRIARRLSASSSATPTMTFHSFCYGVVRQFSASDHYVAPLQLMSAPEQQTVIAELIAGGDPAAWPQRLWPALRTRGFAAELQGLMAAASIQDLGLDDLADLAEQSGRAEWVAAAAFFEEYTQVLALQNKSDYTDVVVQAVRLLREPEVRDELRDRYRLVVVDEYQDTDPLQVQLLHELAGDGRDLIVVGDPDQSIYRFRGADLRGILDFPRAFGSPGEPAPLVALGTTRRFGPRILTATRSIVEPLGVSGHLDAEIFARFRSPASAAQTDGDVEVNTYATPAAEGEHIARLLREAHLTGEHPLAWSDMAVLVRTGAELIRLERVLVASGVPVEVAGDEIPLASQPAVRVLLAAVRVAEHVAAQRPVPLDEATAFLTGPLGRLDASEMRRVNRFLRDGDRDHPGGPRPSSELLASALRHPLDLAARDLAPATQLAVDRAARAAEAVARAAAQILDREAPEQVLWTLWSAGDWQRRLLAEAESSGESSLRAHRDLDAVGALFQQAARVEETGSHRTVAALIHELEAQQIPADTLSESGVRGTAVRLMTAHRSKGLEWPLVVVAGVQEDAWPTVRAGGSLLHRERVGPGIEVSAPPTSAQLADERRLFYVACTRATRRLVVTAVRSPRDDDHQPSRFVLELAAHATAGSVTEPQARPRTPFSLRGVVAQLRELCESSDDPVVRHGAAQRLALLADQGSWATRAARPERWWGVRDDTHNDTPVVDPSEPIKLSGSGVSSLTACPLAWFLSHEAAGSTGTTSAQGFGSIVHALAADVVRRGEPADPAAMRDRLDDAWSQLEFAAPWVRERERRAAHEAIERLARWHQTSARTPLAVEHEFRAEIDVDDTTVVLRGYMDRVELDDQGRVHVIDFKTNKNPPPAKDIARYPQLGFYQLAVEHGAVSDLAPDAPSGGAELVQLRVDVTGDPGSPKVQQQAAPPEGEPFFALDQVTESVRIIRTEDFRATPSKEACQWCEFAAACPSQPEGAPTVGRRDPGRES